LTQAGATFLGEIDGISSLYWGDGGHYPAGAPVLDQYGHLQHGLSPDNTFPMCARIPSDANTAAQLDAYLKAHPIGGASGSPMPYCPSELFADGNKLVFVNDGGPVVRYTDSKKWAARGAINAGAAVFLYLDQLERGLIKPTPFYTQCEQLTSAQSAH
jgi:hypothetical protein